MNNERSYYAHPTSVVDEGATLGAGTKIWHFCHIMKGCKLGRNCNIGQNVVISPDVEIGNGVKVQNNVSLYTGLRCEDDVFIGPSAVFTNVTNPRAFIVRKDQFKSTILEKGCSIGANATIVCGHTIGAYALIGAGSVIVSDVPAYALMVGNPARQKGWVSKAGWTLEFDANGIAVCPETGERYQIKDGQLLPLGKKA